MLVETQKKIFELIKSEIDNENNVFIINGNPGTGKSVVAINLLNEIIKKGKTVQYVVNNNAFRNALIDSLKTHAELNKTKDGLNTLFSGAKKFFNYSRNSIDWAIVDEAHRLRLKKKVKDVNQIDDIMKASKNVVFFVDENQTIRTNDIGTTQNILESAKKFNKKIFYGEEFLLETQFRCVEAQGYINSINNALQIQESANFYLDDNGDYDFKICNSPQEMEDLLNKQVEKGFKNSKILAGYAWEWISNKCKKDSQLNDIKYHDIKIDNWSIPWNFDYKDKLWAKMSQNKRQAGSIHMVQGLEFDYCGVIIGNDLKIDNEGKVRAVSENYYDEWGKKDYRKDEIEDLTDNDELSRLIKNIYMILLTRAQKGTFVYICDQDLRNHFKKFLKNNIKENN